MSRKRTEAHEFLTNLLFSPEGQKNIQEVYEDAMKKRKERVTSINCPRCKEMKKVDIEVERYSLKDITSFLKWASETGVIKPAQVIEETKEVRVQHALIALKDASIEELRAIAEGPRELEP